MSATDATTRDALTEHRNRTLDAARAHFAQSGRGALITVHAGGEPQFVFYRAPGDLDEYAGAGGLGLIRDAIRTYDPAREAVVLVADGVHERFACWRLSSDGVALVWEA